VTGDLRSGVVPAWQYQLPAMCVDKVHWGPLSLTEQRSSVGSVWGDWIKELSLTAATEDRTCDFRSGLFIWASDVGTRTSAMHLRTWPHSLKGDGLSDGLDGWECVCVCVVESAFYNQGYLMFPPREKCQNDSPIEPALKILTEHLSPPKRTWTANRYKKTHLSKDFMAFFKIKLIFITCINLQSTQLKINAVEDPHMIFYKVIMNHTPIYHCKLCDTFISKTGYKI